jgi:RHS repeat-associated protein
LLKFTAPDGNVAEVKYEFDELSRLKKVIAPDGNTVYAYDAVGNRDKVTYANGTFTQYGYDKLNRLTSLATHKADTSLLASYQYTLAPTGHRTQITEHSGRVIDYTYDDLYRLKEEAVTQADGGEVSFSYQYDAVGNRVYSIEDGVHTKYTYDSNDRLKKQGGVTYLYDDNGNTVQITEEGDVTKLDYDDDNRLIAVVTEENGQVTSTVSYVYDADGNRVQTEVDGQVTQYVVDSNDSLAQVIAELDSNDQVEVAYLYGDDLVSQYRGNDVAYYHYDGLGSTRALTDSTATVTNTYSYEAFGSLMEQTGETENNYLFTGEQIDPNTGNYYLRARFYNPGSGRFLSMDSFDGNAQEPVTLHKYLYGNGDPVNMVDPSGYFSVGSFSAGNAVSGILNSMRYISKGLDILNFVTDPAGAVTEKLTNKALGALVILSRLNKSTQKFFLRLGGACSSEKKKSSFIAGTLVHTERGLVPIEDIGIGDLVLSYDEKTRQNQYNEVINLIQGEHKYDIVTLTLENGNIIEATAEHPFYINGKGWNPASSLKVGQVLQLHNGVTIIINEIDTSIRFAKVYNLTVANTHNYFVSQSGVFVHNSSDGFCTLRKATKYPVIKYGTRAWDKAVIAIRNATGKGNNVRVTTQKEALMLIQEARPGISRRRSYAGSKKSEGFGYEYHLKNETEQRGGEYNDLLHIKWYDWRVNGKNSGARANGHIFFDIWN